MKDKFSVLNKIAALGIGLGVFQLLASQGFFNQLEGFLFYLPLVLLWAFFLFVINRAFGQKTKKNFVILTTLAFLGFLTGSLLGHKIFEQQLLSQPGAVKIE